MSPTLASSLGYAPVLAVNITHKMIHIMAKNMRFFANCFEDFRERWECHWKNNFCLQEWNENRTHPLAAVNALLNVEFYINRLYSSENQPELQNRFHLIHLLRSIRQHLEEIRTRLDHFLAMRTEHLHWESKPHPNCTSELGNLHVFCWKETARRGFFSMDYLREFDIRLEKEMFYAGEVLKGSVFLDTIENFKLKCE
ncbi:unnamed protein product [Cyprideis torosa]|uniref:Uncharacterized protein n=1 Tax=Cyprideis torosa TaxID=163714 RepID=A0A7R8WGU2_9CRUS|nr:unnamed protein product [Cyprideis torosa]CAG0893024.1 unnamed protein product [Cyprideis torosa]